MATTTTNIFWGMTLHPDKRYAQTAVEAFHISKACLEPSPNPKLTSIYLESQDEEFLLCTLGGSNLNETLDLNFNMGEKICLRAEGGGIIHLTGYLVESGGDDEFYPFIGEEGEEEEEVDSEEESDIDSEEEAAQISKRLISNFKDLITKKQTPLDKLLAEKKKKKEEGKSPKKPEEVLSEIKKAEQMKKKLQESKSEDSDSDDDDEDDDDDSSDDESDENMLDLEAEEGEEESDDDDEDDSDDDDVDDDSSDEIESPLKNGQKKAESPKNKIKQEPVTPVSSKKAKKEAAASPASDKKAKKVAEENGTPKSVKKEKKAENQTPAKKGDENNDSTSSKKKKKENGSATPGKENGKAVPAKTPTRTLKGGLIVEETKVGTGPETKRGKLVGMFYEGKLKSNNKTFDQSKDKPFKFRLGQGEVIKGWDLGIEGMKVGGKRRLIVPPALAYGPKGAPPDIPPNATLVFDVECKFVS